MIEAQSHAAAHIAAVVDGFAAEGEFHESMGRWLRSESELRAHPLHAASTKEALADANAMLESEGKW